MITIPQCTLHMCKNIKCEHRITKALYINFTPISICKKHNYNELYEEYKENKNKCPYLNPIKIEAL